MIKFFLINFVKAYRLLLSPWLGSACRFEPTCSAYSLQALQEHGAATGSYLTLRRLARCHPGCEGGYDPVPEIARAGSPATPRLFAQLFAHSTQHSSSKKSS